jgi:hypothetical protein
MIGCDVASALGYEDSLRSAVLFFISIGTRGIEYIARTPNPTAAGALSRRATS